MVKVKDMTEVIKKIPFSKVYIKARKINNNVKAKRTNLKTGFDQLVSLLRTTYVGRITVASWSKGHSAKPIYSKRAVVKHLTDVIPTVAKTEARNEMKLLDVIPYRAKPNGKRAEVAVKKELKRVKGIDSPYLQRGDNSYKPADRNCFDTVISNIESSLINRLSGREPFLSGPECDKALDLFKQGKPYKVSVPSNAKSYEVPNSSKRRKYNKAKRIYHRMLNGQINPIKAVDMTIDVILGTKYRCYPSLYPREWGHWVWDIPDKDLTIKRLKAEQPKLEPLGYEYYISHDITKPEAERYAVQDCRLEKNALDYIKKLPKDLSFCVPQEWLDHHHGTFMTYLRRLFIAYFLEVLEDDVDDEQSVAMLKAGRSSLQLKNN